jgi:hypothetical protein
MRVRIEKLLTAVSLLLSNPLLVSSAPTFRLDCVPGQSVTVSTARGRGRMADSLQITEKVRAVAQMGRPELVSEWQAQFGAPPPSRLRMELMRPILVYRIQENAYGLSGSDGEGPSGALHRMRIVAASRQVRRSFASGRANSTRSRSRLKAMFTTARCTRAFRRSRLGSLERGGRGPVISPGSSGGGCSRRQTRLSDEFPGIREFCREVAPTCTVAQPQITPKSLRVS